MDKLKHDTLKVGDTFKISYTPRTHNSEIIDVVASTEFGRAFITLNGKSYILNKHDNLEDNNDNN
jgi:hypothetical protein